MVVNNKRHYWIGVGLEPKKKKSVLDDARKVDIALNPGTQSTFFKTPPRLPKSNQALLRKNSSMMLSLLGVYNEEIEKNKQTDADNEQDDLDATKDRSIAQMMIKTKRASTRIFTPRHSFYFSRFLRTKSPTQFKPLKVC
jgi:hypothetical protein